MTLEQRVRRLMREDKRVRRTMAEKLKRMLAPYLWASGYGSGTKVFAFAPLYPDKCGDTHYTRSMGMVDDTDLRSLQGFWAGGTMDAVGGGMACTHFEAHSVNDLLRIHNWLCLNLTKEVARRKAYDQSRNEQRAINEKVQKQNRQVRRKSSQVSAQSRVGC